VGAAKKEIVVKYTLRQYPPELREKVMDLEQFNKNFTKKGQKAVKLFSPNSHLINDF